MPKNIPKVKMPHIMKYAAKDDEDGAKPANSGNLGKSRYHHETPPEQAIREESYSAESVAFFELHCANNNLGYSSVSNAHS